MRACGNKWRYDSGTELGLQGAAAGANGLDKKLLSERDICTKFITPAVKRAGWDELTQLREEVSFTKGRIIVRGRLVTRGKAKRADYILYYKPNIPIALIEARELPLPLPPLAEQHRIVAKVDELMALCDRLDAQLTTTHTETRRLLEAVLHQALTPVA